MANQQNPSQADPGSVARERFSVSEILNTVCHDIRATLSVTAGSATELGSSEHGPLTAMQEQLVGIIQRGNARLARLAGNLMHLSELWDGSLELRRTRADLVPMVRQAVEELARQDPGNRAHFDLRLPAAPVEAAVDPERFRQVMANLLGLAFAVAQRRVGVSLTARPGEVELVVEDDGPERRRTSRQDGLKRVSSTELALAVCEGLVLAHGGTLELESPAGPGGGSRSRARLPTADDSTP